MFEKWVVLVKVCYNSISFEFDSAEKAVEFAKIALVSAKLEADNKGNVWPAHVTINAKNNDEEDE